MKTTHIFLKSALVLAMAAPLMASADSQLVIGNATQTTGASANLDFRVIIPRVLFLQVGNATTVDEVEFDLGSTQPGSGTVNRTNGTTVPVTVLGNGGLVTLTSTNGGDLISGTDTIPWSQIAATSSDPTNFPSPSPVGAAVSLGLTAGKVTNRTADWTFTFANSAVVGEGTYVGQVTYTATLP
jgi:hypothetical protein